MLLERERSEASSDAERAACLLLTIFPTESVASPKLQPYTFSGPIHVLLPFPFTVVNSWRTLKDVQQASLVFLTIGF
jgi:hypothetical protein